MPSKQLFIVRIALMAGVFTFAGIALYQRATNTTAPPVAELPVEALRYVLWVLVGASALAALFLKSRVEAAPYSKKALFTLIGWSFGEGVALLGIILHYLGGPMTSLALGMLAFVFSLLLLPVPRERR